MTKLSHFNFNLMTIQETIRTQKRESFRESAMSGKDTVTVIC